MAFYFHKSDPNSSMNPLRPSRWQLSTLGNQNSIKGGNPKLKNGFGTIKLEPWDQKKPKPKSGRYKR